MITKQLCFGVWKIEMTCFKSRRLERVIVSGFEELSGKTSMEEVTHV